MKLQFVPVPREIKSTESDEYIYIFFTVPNYLPFHVSLSMIHIPINFYTVRKIKLLQTRLYPMRQSYGHWSAAILTDKGHS